MSISTHNTYNSYNKYLKHKINIWNSLSLCEKILVIVFNYLLNEDCKNQEKTYSDSI